METLLALDHQIFLLINHLPHGFFIDGLALGLSGIGAGGFIWFILSIVLFIREEKRDHWFFLPVILAGAASQFITMVILKNLFGRSRPPISLGTIHVGMPLSDYSFPSGHATFAFALATVLAHKEPRLTYFFYGLACLICISRIYLGNHYPSDVIAGSIVGWGIGVGCLWIEKKVGVAKKIPHRRKT